MWSSVNQVQCVNFISLLEMITVILPYQTNADYFESLHVMKNINERKERNIRSSSLDYLRVV